jgi:hypothetical protein
MYHSSHGERVAARSTVAGVGASLPGLLILLRILRICQRRYGDRFTLKIPGFGT